MAIVRDNFVIRKFHEIRDKENPTREDYELALCYTLVRIIFSNGARAEIAYKSKLEVKYIWFNN